MTPQQARDELRGLLLVAAAAAVPDRQPVVAFDPGPTAAGALCDGATRTVSSRVRVEIATPDGGRHDDRLADTRRHLTTQGWSVVRSGATEQLAELVAVHDGCTLSVIGRVDERRLVLTGETRPLPAGAAASAPAVPVSGPGSG